MKQDIRLKTVLIIKKDGEYLVAKCPVTGRLIWRDSKWEAWKTRTRAKARSVVEKTGGEIYLFNPVAGQIRKYMG